MTASIFLDMVSEIGAKVRKWRHFLVPKSKNGVKKWHRINFFYKITLKKVVPESDTKK